MRGSILILTLALSITSPPAYSSNPPKAGALCSKKGVEKTHKGKTFSCTQAGKKMIWKKISKKSSNDLPTFDSISLWQAVVETINSKPSSSLDNRVIAKVSQRASKFNTKAIVDATKEASSYFQQFFVLDRDINLWILQPQEDLFLDTLIANKPESVKNFFREEYKSTDGGSAGIAPDGTAYVFFVLYDDYVPERSFNTRHITYHEMTHVFQVLYNGRPNPTEVFRDCQPDEIRCQPKVLIPCWYGEGVAELFGWANNGKTADLSKAFYQSIRWNNINTWVSGPSDFSKEFLSNFLSYPKQGNDWCRNWRGPVSYNLGQLIAEKFVLDFGLNSLVSLISKLGNDSYIYVLKNITGLDEEKWFQETVIPYLANLGSGNEVTLKREDFERKKSLLKFSQDRLDPSPREWIDWRILASVQNAESHSEASNSSSNEQEAAANDPENLNGIECGKEDEIVRNSVGEFWCQRDKGGVLRWAKNNVSLENTKK